MTSAATAADSGYGIQADIICVEMSAAEAAALRELQMNELSPSPSETSVKSGNHDKTSFPDPKVYHCIAFA